MFKIDTRKRLASILLLLISMTGILYCGMYYNGELLVYDLRGRWKTTELAAVYTMGIIYWFEDIYLGRSITIDPKTRTIKKSIEMWPYNMEEKSYEYQYIKRTNQLGANVYILDNLKEMYDDPMSEFVSVYKDEELLKVDIPIEKYVVCQDGRILTEFFDGWYFAEPYVKAKTDLKAHDLTGSWKVNRLVSYEDGWIGNREQLEFCKVEIEHLFTELEGWEERDDIDFYPKNYYDDVLKISEKEISLFDDQYLLESHKITDIESNILRTADYEESKGIHDELGISNKKIQVFTMNFSDNLNTSLLDGEIVIVNEEKIITKIQQGWYLLVKETF